MLLLLALDLFLQLADLGEEAVDLVFLLVFKFLMQFAQAWGAVMVVVGCPRGDQPGGRGDGVGSG